MNGFMVENKCPIVRISLIDEIGRTHLSIFVRTVPIDILDICRHLIHPWCIPRENTMQVEVLFFFSQTRQTYRINSHGLMSEIVAIVRESSAQQFCQPLDQLSYHCAL